MDFIPHAVTGLVSALLPSSNLDVRMYSGILAGGIARVLMSNTSQLGHFIPTRLRSNCLYISEFDSSGDGKINPIFEQLQEYIVFTHMKRINLAQVIPKKGEITILPRAGLKFQDSYLEKPLTLYVTSSSESQASSSGSSSSSSSQPKSTICISSSQLTTSELREFVQHICKLEKTLHSTIAVYRSIVHAEQKDRPGHIEWDKVFIKTNKTLENTIYSDNVMKTLFDDVEWFMHNEEWFTKRGMSYKRCYLLHGPPGTGKTSVTKILANKYKLPVFLLDMQSIKSDSDLTKIVSEISYLADGRYILSIEDIDRCSMFRDRYYEDRERSVSVPCFLNFLDGIVETHGCIRIFSANDVNQLEQHPSAPAMFRPGRIDVKVLIEHCDVTQLAKMFSIFFEEVLNDDVVISKDLVICPSQFIFVMTRFSKSDVIEFLQTGKIMGRTIDSILSSKSSGGGDSSGIAPSGFVKFGVGRGRKHARGAKQTPIQQLQNDSKELAKLEKMMERVYNRTEKIRDKLYTKVSILEKKKKRIAERENLLTTATVSSKRQCILSSAFKKKCSPSSSTGIVTRKLRSAKRTDTADTTDTTDTTIVRDDDNQREDVAISKPPIVHIETTAIKKDKHQATVAAAATTTASNATVPIAETTTASNATVPIATTTASNATVPIATTTASNATVSMAETTTAGNDSGFCGPPTQTPRRSQRNMQHRSNTSIAGN